MIKKFSSPKMRNRQFVFEPKIQYQLVTERLVVIYPEQLVVSRVEPSRRSYVESKRSGCFKLAISFLVLHS